MSFNDALAKYHALIAIADAYKLKEDPNHTGYACVIDHPSDGYPNGRVLFANGTNAETITICTLSWKEANE